MNKTYLSRLPTGATAAVDAISTSSSTLVNPDLDEDTLRRRQHRSPTTQPLSYDRANIYNGMRPNFYTPDGWMKGETVTSSFNRTQSPKIEYPDDHRCSDQETASGLCGCNRNASPDSEDSSTPMTGSEQEEAGHSAKVDSSYDQQLIAARKRKLMMEQRSQSAETITVMRAETSNGLRGSTSQVYNGRIGNGSRDLHSDPVLVPRPASLNNYEDDEWESSIPKRPWASSPVHSAFQEKDRIGSTKPTTTALDKMQISPSKISKPSPSSAPAPPSAARKSISSVFEKLLKEEEQRREEERAKKEAARERRRESKRRKEEEWPRTSEAKADVTLGDEGELSQRKGTGLERGSDGITNVSLPPETSLQSQQDATRLERLARKAPFSSPVVKIAPRPSPEKPAASSYKAKLAALRSASFEDKVPPIPMKRLSDPISSSPRQARAKPTSSNHSLSDDSLTSEADPVTIGFDFQGQAPLQSTPPRNSPSTRARMLIESPSARVKTPDTSIVEESLRQTVQQLTSVLHEVRDIKGDVTAIDTTPIVELKKASEQRDLALQTVSNEGRKRITDIDEAYVQKLGQIRERLQEAKSKTPVERISKQPRSLWTRNLLMTLLLQLLFAWLMVMAAEARARQLFLTSYYDPFLPHDIVDLSYAHTGSLFTPLLQRWNLTPAEMILPEDISPSQTWTDTISRTAHDLLHGPERTRAVRLLSIKIFTVLGLEPNDSYSIGSFAPT